MTNAPILSLRDIRFRLPRETDFLLCGASLDLRQGERIGLSGPNGSGKSTLLHIATGLVRPESGKVFFNGRELSTEKDFAAARPQAGYLLQRTEDQLFCPTVLEDVAFGPLNLGLSSENARLRAEETLALLGISHLAERSGCNLSGGEQKLAALAAVFSMRPRLLLLDEPTNDLDPKTRRRLMDILKASALPFIAVSHDETFLDEVANRRLRLEDGLVSETDSG